MKDYSKFEILDKKILEETKEVVGEKFNIIINYYVNDGEKYVSQIEEGIKSEEHQSILESAHTIKSSSRQVGAIRTAELAAEIESMSNSKESVEDIKVLFEQLNMSFNEVAEELKNIVKG